MKITSLQQARKYLFQFIPQDRKFKFPGQLGLDRSRYLLQVLGAPQEKIKVIHIAGTSGKGSTAYFTATLLKAHGFTVGLHISPHLVDIRERFQINGNLISEREFCLYLAEIVPAIKKTAASTYGKPTYFEIIVALSFYIFHKKKVDYAVVETGLGGWYDATNVVSSPDKLCILTRIGIDHTKVLGNTLAQIALQKVHIVQKKNTVITIKQKKVAQTVVENFVKGQEGRLIISPINKKLHLNLEGAFQKENASLALSALKYLSDRDMFQMSESKVNNVLANTVIRGRFEIFEKKDKKIIVDGAHNPQKMSAFTKSLKKRFPNQKFIFLIAFKEGKDFKGMLKYIIPLAKRIIITQFWVDTTYSKLSLSEEPKDIIKIIKKLGYTEVEIIMDSKEALKQSIIERKDVVITGSLYFIGEIYPLVSK